MYTFGILGLGKIGASIAQRAIEAGCNVVGYDPGSKEKLESLGVNIVYSLEELCNSLPHPKVIWFCLPAGNLVDSYINELIPYLSFEDVVIDGGDSYWGDSISRAHLLNQKGIHFIDIGISDRVSVGPNQGPCFLVGAEYSLYQKFQGLFQCIACPGGLVHCGAVGTGHFTKLVHNGIELGMMQAIGEGLELLERFPLSLHIESILQAWQHGSGIRSYLIELLYASYKRSPELDQVPSYIEDNGEINRLITDAMNLDIPIPIITQSVIQLIASRDFGEQSYRAVGLMRNASGQYPLGPNHAIKNLRKLDKVSAYYDFDTKRDIV